jgi:FAD/FMN-containing dehydrogenase
MTITRSIPLSALELSAAMRDAHPYDAKRLDRVLRVDERHGLVEVQAATPWKAIAAALRPGDARSASASGRTTLPTVGESLAHNAAGPDGRPAVTHVESITLVAPGGELRRASRTANRELFALAAGGQDLFGALYSVTLDIGSLQRAVNEAAAAEVIAAPQAGAPSRPLRLLVLPDKVDAFLAEARHRCAEWRLPLAGVEVRRTAEEQDSFLRWARREYAALTLHLGEPPALGVAVRTTQLRQSLIDAAIEHGGSFPVSCTPEATRAQVESCYPQLRAFLAEKRRIDPAERITNSWYRHYRSLFSPVQVRWTH